jgi:probable RNA-binding protein EIF1AD
MGKAKATKALFNTLGVPPDGLKPAEFIVKVGAAKGNSLYSVRIPESSRPQLEAFFVIPPEAEVPVTEEINKKKKPAPLDDDSDLDESSSEEEEEEEAQIKLGPELMVEMPPKFRNTIFIKRGGYCVVTIYDELVAKSQPVAASSTSEPAETNETTTTNSADLEKPSLADYRVHGELSNIVVNDKDWQKYPYWPLEFRRVTKGWDISSDEEESEEEEYSD